MNDITLPSANDEAHNPVAELRELRVEHHDLNDAIDRLEASPPYDELLLKRMKKRKLHLKDRIATLERLVQPGELA